jgi:hypothetical protein
MHLMMGIVLARKLSDEVFKHHLLFYMNIFFVFVTILILTFTTSSNKRQGATEDLACKDQHGHGFLPRIKK